MATIREQPDYPTDMPGWIAKRSVLDDLRIAERVNRMDDAELDRVWAAFSLMEKKHRVTAYLLEIDQQLLEAARG